eukprot:TRINITY_DN3840_c0_g1_i2.p1 TRINITY_DN3840_c0_g1~~TRINITY_DN3840_c0_g1_i2.p1  ORF type:complete len:532 (-),score=112.87 TRINITY_DN3840_c0_g1_i2:47-1642(-)
MTPVDLLVIDGITFSDRSMIVPMLKLARRVIFVTSMQVNIKVEAMQICNMIHIRSYGWTLKEYKEACKNEPFYASIKSNLDYHSILEKTQIQRVENINQYEPKKPATKKSKKKEKSNPKKPVTKKPKKPATKKSKKEKSEDSDISSDEAKKPATKKLKKKENSNSDISSEKSNKPKKNKTLKQKRKVSSEVATLMKKSKSEINEPNKPNKSEKEFSENPKKIKVEPMKNQNDEKQIMLDELSEKEIKKRCIKEKFYLAGHSARWMFFFNSAKVIEAIQLSFMTVNNCEDILSNSIGPSSNKAINTLITIFEDKNNIPYVTIVSQYVTKMMIDKSQPSFLTTATNFAERVKNGSLDGWIFQYDFLHSIETRESISVIKSTGSEETWKISAKLYLPTLSTISTINKEQFQHNLWLIPTQTNFGGFDFLFFRRRQNGWAMYALQLTVSNYHDLKAKFLHKAISKIQIAISKVVFIFIVPHTQILHFKIKQKDIIGITDELAKVWAADEMVDLFTYGYKRINVKTLENTKSNVVF